MGKKRAVAALIGLVGLAISPAGASAASAASAAPAEGTETSLPPQVLDALERDLGLTASEVQARLANEATASASVDRLQRTLGSSFAGVWLAGDVGTLTVAVTDADEVDDVRSAGVTPRLVHRSEADLDAVLATLDRTAATAPDAVTGWYVDVPSNQVVVETYGDSTASARRFVTASGVDATAVRVVTTTQRPRLLYDVIGGDAYFTPQFRCSVGFPVEGGYTTAGHCGDAGTTTSGVNQVAQGSFQASSFPGDDHAWVAVNSDWVPVPIVNGYGQGDVTVQGATVAPVGSSVCRSGSTTGWQCGTVQALDQTVNYQEGTVFGLTQTSACAEGGDSGGAFISGNQAQGMTSGGSGDCTVGGTTFFQPVGETLSTYGLTLVTG
jgi:streptogrisin C